MYSLLFRNRWFAAIWALGILGTAYGVATRGTPVETVQPEVAARQSEAAFAAWAHDDVKTDEVRNEESADTAEADYQGETSD